MGLQLRGVSGSVSGFRVLGKCMVCPKGPNRPFCGDTCPSHTSMYNSKNLAFYCIGT